MRGVGMVIRASTRRIRIAGRALRTLFNGNTALAGGGGLSRPKRFTYIRGMAIMNPGDRVGVSVLNPREDTSRIRVSLASTHGLNVTTPIERSNSVTNAPNYGLINPRNRIRVRYNMVTTGERVRLSPGATRRFNLGSGRLISIGINRGANETAAFNSIMVEMGTGCTPTVRVSASRSGTTNLNNAISNRVVTWFQFGPGRVFKAILGTILFILPGWNRLKRGLEYLFEEFIGSFVSFARDFLESAGGG